MSTSDDKAAAGRGLLGPRHLLLTACGALLAAACGEDEPLDAATCRVHQDADGGRAFYCGDAGTETGSDGSVDGERRHVILFIGDGMQLEHEIAASRYLTGTDDGLVFHGFPYNNYVTTWDVTTYNRHAWSEGADPYDPNDFDPTLGYDPARGGEAPYPLAEVPDDGYFLNLLEGYEPFRTAAVAATDSASAGTAIAISSSWAWP